MQIYYYIKFKLVLFEILYTFSKKKKLSISFNKFVEISSISWLLK